MFHRNFRIWQMGFFLGNNVPSRTTFLCVACTYIMYTTFLSPRIQVPLYITYYVYIHILYHIDKSTFLECLKLIYETTSWCPSRLHPLGWIPLADFSLPQIISASRIHPPSLAQKRIPWMSTWRDLLSWKKDELYYILQTIVFEPQNSILITASQTVNWCTAETHQIDHLLEQICEALEWPMKSCLS